MADLDTALVDDVAELLFNCTSAQSQPSPKSLEGYTPLKSSTAPHLEKLDDEIRKSRETSRLRMYRRRVRNERESLQRQEKLMLAKLAQLKHTRPDPTRPILANVGISRSMWKAIASQQLHERQAAEAEQKHLKASIKAQDACIEALQDIFRTQQAEDIGKAESAHSRP